MSRTATKSLKRWLMSSSRSRCPRFDAMVVMGVPSTRQFTIAGPAAPVNANLMFWVFRCASRELGLLPLTPPQPTRETTHI
jgi:hypothetical protein